MRVVFTLLLVILSFTCIYSQDHTATQIVFDTLHLDVGEKPPQPPAKFNEWFASHVVYPKSALDSNQQATVYVSCIIQTDGSISYTHIEKMFAVPKMLEQEARRIMAIMPNWTIGYKKGLPVPTELILSIQFSLGPKELFGENSSGRKYQITLRAMRYILNVPAY